MPKRQKWTAEEDSALISLISTFPRDAVDWKRLTERMNQLGFQKTRKQIFERWTTNLDPSLDLKSLDSKGEAKLFSLQHSLSSHWRKIASHFPGKSDNYVKNKFFALLRKTLRHACKMIKKPNCTKWVNSLKPRSIIKTLDCSLFGKKTNGEFAFGKELVSFRDVILSINERTRGGTSFELTTCEKEVLVFFLSKLEKENKEYRAKTLKTRSAEAVQETSNSNFSLDRSKMLAQRECSLRERIGDKPKLLLKTERNRETSETGLCFEGTIVLNNATPFLSSGLNTGLRTFKSLTTDKHSVSDVSLPRTTQHSSNSAFSFSDMQRVEQLGNCPGSGIEKLHVELGNRESDKALRFSPRPTVVEANLQLFLEANPDKRKNDLERRFFRPLKEF